MDIQRITKDFAVCGQVSAKDISQVHALGYATILCMRPDAEEPAHALYESIARAADTTGIAAEYLPIPASGPTDENVAAFANLYPGLPKPVLAYCRSGGRAKTTYQRAYPENT